MFVSVGVGVRYAFHLQRARLHGLVSRGCQCCAFLGRVRSLSAALCLVTPRPSRDLVVVCTEVLRKDLQNLPARHLDAHRVQGVCFNVNTGPRGLRAARKRC